MFSTSPLLSVLLALAVSASPVVTIRDAPVTLQISRSLNMTNIANLYQNDFNRVQALKVHGTGNVAINTPVVNRGLRYIAAVGVGSPPTSYNLVVDTGSRITWIGASKRYVKTRSSTQTASQVSVKYLDTSLFSGTLYIDNVTLAPGFAVRQMIGVALTTRGFKGIDGILGLGPVASTAETLTPGSNLTIPTVTDNLFAAHMIPVNVLAISFQPFTGKPVINGQLTWGAVDRSKFIGNITYVPITSPSGRSSNYWSIKQTIRYGGTTILSDGVGVVDTGASLLHIASDAFAKYRAATSATFERRLKMWAITPASFARMQSLFFKIGPTSFEFTVNAQIWPRTLNSAIGGSRGKVYLVVADIGHNSGQGLDFINGQVWLERFYSVYDTTNKRLGIANTPFTTARTN